MAHIVTTITIARAPAAVFEFVTTPSFWPSWHPSSESVAMSDGQAAEHPLRLGEQVREHIVASGLRDHVVWTVVEYDYPRRWVISGRAGSGASAILSYELQAHGTRTLFRRELDYKLRDNAGLGALDQFLIRWRAKHLARRTLLQLRALLERQ